MASFWRISIKAFPLPHLEAAGATHEIHSSKAFVSSPQPLFYENLVIYEKTKWWVERILFVST
jgi:hypothetical protein